MARAMAMLVAATLLASEAAAQDLTPIGDFSNVRVSSATGEPHCYGVSLTLWAHQGRVLGLLDRHNGLCGDPPCAVLQDVSFEPGSGRLRFRSSEAKGGEFAGTLRRDDVVGTLDGRRVRMQRQTDRAWGSHDRQLESWCRFWSGVSRCSGVTEFCASAGRVR